MIKLEAGWDRSWGSGWDKIGWKEKAGIAEHFGGGVDTYCSENYLESMNVILI